MSAPATPRPFVVAMVRADLSSRRRMMEGIARYAHRHARWDVLAATQVLTPDGAAPLVRRADGVLLAPADPYLALAQQATCPCVVIGESFAGERCVCANETAIGQLALSHFRDLGLRHVAFIGLPAVDFSCARRDGLRASAGRAAVHFHEYPRTVYSQMDSDPHELESFHRWLLDLPKPVGLLCVTAEMAHIVVHHCRNLDLHVPDQVAILGVDDDDLVCEITRPHLSTIDQAADELGFRAAQMLDAVLGGGSPPRLVIVPPRQVIIRESTDLVHSDSRAIGQALRLIRQNVLKEDVSVRSILQQVPISRRALERGFLRNIGRTVHQEILRLRIERAKELLASTNLKTSDIAARSGLQSASMLCNVFRRELRISPIAYRRQARAETPSPEPSVSANIA